MDCNKMADVAISMSMPFLSYNGFRELLFHKGNNFSFKDKKQFIISFKEKLNIEEYDSYMKNMFDMIYIVRMHLRNDVIPNPIFTVDGDRNEII